MPPLRSALFLALLALPAAGGEGRTVDGAAATVKLAAPADVRWLRSGQFGIGKPVVDAKPGENHCLQLDRNTTASSYRLNARDGTADPKTARRRAC